MKKLVFIMALLLSASLYAGEVSVSIASSQVNLTTSTDVEVKKIDLEVTCQSSSNARFGGDPIAGGRFKIKDISLDFYELADIEIEGKKRKQYAVSLEDDILLKKKFILKHNVHQCFLTLSFDLVNKKDTPSPLVKSVFDKLIYNNYYDAKKYAVVDLTEEFRSYMKGLSLENRGSLKFAARKWLMNTWSYDRKESTFVKWDTK